MTATTSGFDPSLMRFASAREMQQAAVLVAKHNRETGARRSIGAIYFLMGFALELYLKAFLLRSGLDDVALGRRPYAHDLRRLYFEASARGLAFAEAAELEVMVEALADAHADFSFRYMQPNSTIRVPEPIEAALKLLSRLDDHLARPEDVALARAEIARE